MSTVIRNNDQAIAKIANREEFRNARTTFSGDIVNPEFKQGLRYVGYLPKGFHDSLSRADYVVYSYSTPIGWHVPGEGWHVPEVSYSTTTSSQHQTRLRRAVTPILPRSWTACPGSNAAAEILRSIRAGYSVNVKGRTRRVIDLVLATGEALLVNDDTLVGVAHPLTVAVSA
jgi:hypothetical protein